MSNTLYFMAIILMIIWAISFFAYMAGPLIHVLLVLALIAVLLQIIKGRS